MDTPRDTAAAFDRIAAEIEPLLTRLGRAAPGAELETMRDEITALLDGAGLRWSDLAARVTAPPPAKASATQAHRPPPEWEMPAVVPKRPDAPDSSKVLTDEERLDRFVEQHTGGGTLLSAATVLTDEQLAAYGYRSAGTAIPGADTSKPAE